MEAIAPSNRTRSRALGAVLVLLFALAGAWPAKAAEIELPVPKVTVYPGNVIDQDLLYGRLFVASSVTRSSVFESPEAVVGKVAKQTLLPGRPIPVNAVRDPYAVVQGKSSQIVFQSEGLLITGYGIALQNGVIGDVIDIRNIDSGNVIKGTVQADGTVRVGAP